MVSISGIYGWVEGVGEKVLDYYSLCMEIASYQSLRLVTTIAHRHISDFSDGIIFDEVNDLLLKNVILCFHPVKCVHK